MKQIALLIILSFIGVAAMAQPKRGLLAPDIKLPNTKGEAVALSSLKGKVVLIDFWASWCGPCRRAMPDLRELYKAYKDKGFEIYGISVDDDLNAWKQAIFEDRTKWLHVNDAKGDIATKWNVREIPNSFLLNKDGKVIIINPTPYEIREELKKMLN